MDDMNYEFFGERRLLNTKPEVALRPDCRWNWGRGCPMNNKEETTFCDECPSYQKKGEKK